jgi:acyl-homoserine lactone acylase PvdQ
MMLALLGSGARASVPAETGRFYNILPAGQHGSDNAIEGAQFEMQGTRPAHFDDQLGMYANLVYASPGLKDADITKYFKQAGFTVPKSDVTRVEHPRPGLTIVRDKYDVPHIYGNTAADVFYGTGYVNGEDRLFVTDVLRHVGRARLAEFLGATPENLAMDRGIAAVAGYSEAELQQQLDVIPGKFGAAGVVGQEAVKSYVEGINGWIQEALTDPTKLPAEYPALQLVPQPWSVTDVVAVATLIQAIFAAGGGGEMRNVALQQALQGKYPAAVAKGIFGDLLQHEDPAAPVSTSSYFPYQAQGRIDPRSVAIPDKGSFKGVNPLVTLKDDLRAVGIPVPDAMSNWIAVNADRTADGHPIGVLGPQTGYYAPNLLMEIDMHGGGYDARGATFAGIGLFVLLGRGIDFSWSATSGGSDLTDIRVEKLCNQDGSKPTLKSTSYMLLGECIPMYERTDQYVAKPSAGGVAEPEVITQQIERTAHGPVVGRATVKGQPVAISLQRSTFMAEPDSAISFVLLDSNKVHNPASFFDAMSQETGSFNWLYVDSKNIAYYHSGLYPRRAPGVPYDLPTWGTGEWEWRGFLSANEHPHVVNPSSGYLASWNNKPAVGWRAADDNYSYNDVYRVQSLTELLRPLVARGGIKITDMIDVMEGAATVDLRASQVLPYALRLLGDDPTVAPYKSLLTAWVNAGSHRRARAPNKPYGHQAAIALMDAWYEPMIHAAFDWRLGGFYGTIPMGFDDTNRVNHIGSSFQDGYMGYLQKAFKMRLGMPVLAPFTQLACGTSFADCARKLKASLLATVAALQKKSGGGPAKWIVDKKMETIRFVTVGLVSVPEIDWQNRPTFQQVVQVFRSRNG